MGGTTSWLLARVPSTTEPVATVRRALGNTRTRWSWNRQALTTRRPPPTGATTYPCPTDTHGHFHHVEAFDDTQSEDKDRKRSVQQRADIDGCVLAGRHTTRARARD